mmetsp:Transcript_52186/g.97652  ORF Transcript_52186/g.97652 Transcript_52186/m.97652 type:complete len:138 (+) Transcript_52186:82-495(+)
MFVISVPFLLQALVASAQYEVTVDCEAEPENMYCCPLVSDMPEQCFLEGFDRNTHTCSAACQKRFQSLSYECYQSYKLHFWWKNMEAQCDPTGIVVFRPPETTYRPDYNGMVQADGAEGLARLPWLLIMMLAGGWML